MRRIIFCYFYFYEVIDFKNFVDFMVGFLLVVLIYIFLMICVIFGNFELEGFSFISFVGLERI